MTSEMLRFAKIRDNEEHLIDSQLQVGASHGIIDESISMSPQASCFFFIIDDTLLSRLGAVRAPRRLGQ
jgi:hypothetical protein